MTTRPQAGGEHQDQPPGVVAEGTEESGNNDDEAGRVLVVDDVPQVREVVGRGLTRAGYQVSVAGDGRDALNKLSHGPHIDAVVTDIEMPVMNGAELAAKVLDGYPGIPVLFVSSDDPPEHLHRNPLVDSVGKPPSIAELRGRLSRLLATAMGYRRRKSSQ